MQRGVAPHDRAAERPFGRMLHQLGLNRVFENVVADPGKRVSPPLLFLEHMVVRLMLEFLRRKSRFELRAQECHSVALIGVQA